jgi:hypothetical protein
LLGTMASRPRKPIITIGREDAVAVFLDMFHAPHF